MPLLWYGLSTSSIFILPIFLSFLLFKTDVKCKTFSLTDTHWEPNILLIIIKTLLQFRCICGLLQEEEAKL